MTEPTYPEIQFKRHVAHKLKISEVLEGTQITDGEKLRFIEVHGKNVARVNLVANIIEKYIQDDEKKFASITIDDASGQIKAKTFGEDIDKLKNLEQGETIMLIGLVRQWNNELYIIPEIIKQKTPTYLMIRKLETDLNKPKIPNNTELTDLKGKIIQIIKREEENEGANIDSLVTELKSEKELVNTEIKKLLEEGIIYEPRPGKVRYLG